MTTAIAPGVGAPGEVRTIDGRQWTFGNLAGWINVDPSVVQVERSRDGNILGRVHVGDRLFWTDDGVKWQEWRNDLPPKPAAAFWRAASETSPSVMCSCGATSFQIGCAPYKCWAHCACGQMFIVYPQEQA